VDESFAQALADKIIRAFTAWTAMRMRSALNKLKVVLEK